MATTKWTTRTLPVASLHLDARNPRLGRETSNRAPRDIIQYLFDNDKAFEVSQSIATRGYFPNEPLLAVREDGRLVVVEGNRRLAALKALREPGLLEPAMERKVERLSRNSLPITHVPVTIAPSRRATDRQIVGRHIGTPVLPWKSENRASFILEKLAEGYDNEELREDLGFAPADIQAARQTRAIADMARSLDLPEEVRAKLDSRRAKVFSTLERVFDSRAGREALRVQPDPTHGLRGRTTSAEFVRGFKRLITDVALGKQDSRTLNTNENIRSYFDKWDPKDLPAKKRGSFVPSDIIKGPSVASAQTGSPQPTTRQKRAYKTVLPPDFKVVSGNDRLVDIRKELVKLNRTNYPNAGAVMLRVFLELSIVDYLTRIGELPPIIKKIEAKGGKVPFGVPTMKQLVPEVVRIAKANLSAAKATSVEKSLRYDKAAPFSLSDLHSFVHSSTDFPSDRDILQFWVRTEPLFRMMLEEHGTNPP